MKWSHDAKNAPKNKYRHTQRQLDIMHKLLEGYSHFELIDYLAENYDTKRDAAHRAVYMARKELKGLKKQTEENTLNVHVLRYEDIYKKIKKVGWNQLAMKVLRQKEKLLQIEDGIEDPTKKIHGRVSRKFDEDKLNKEQKKQLTELLAKVE